MKIDEVIQAVYYAARKANKRHHRGAKPVLAVYMEYDYYCECCHELEREREVSGVVFEFIQAGTIAGFEVHRVVSGSLACKITHPPFRVVDITPGD